VVRFSTLQRARLQTEAQLGEGSVYQRKERVFADALPSVMKTWIKFNVIGLVGFGLQTAALFLLTSAAPRVGYLAATAMAVELAVLNNFVWHQRWTWKDRPSATRRETLRRLATFNVTTGLVSIIGNLVLMGVLVGRLGLPIVGANLLTVAVCSMLSFFLADRIAFACNANC
jgi:dolichol-phosphate mannosyltransferase